MATEYSLRGTISGTPSLSGKTNSAASLSANVDNEESISGQTAETESISGKASGKSELAGGMDYVEKGDPGDSAYDIAVKEGFKGTEAEWLESLKGKDGSSPIIIDGYWYVGGVNTQVKAEGVDGKEGEKGDTYALTEDDIDDIANATVKKVNIDGLQSKTDENLETKSKELVGAINELSNGIVGNTWVLYDDLERAHGFTREFKFTSNGREFDAMQGILRQDDTIGEYFVLNYRLASDGRYVQVYYGWSGIGWRETGYQTIFTEDTSVHLSHIGVKKATTVDELLKTKAKSVIGAINEINSKITGAYKHPETGVWYEDEAFIKEINFNLNASLIYIDILSGDIRFGQYGMNLWSVIEQFFGETDVVKWINNFVGDVGDFATAIGNKIWDFFTKEEINTLETEQKIIPLAVNEVNTKVKDVVEGRRKTVASTTDKLAQARKITFTGDVSGEVSFDGSKDESVNITVLNGGKVTNLTNTSFTWNDTPNLSTTGTYNVDFTVDDTNFSKIAILQTYIGGQGLVNIITYDGITVYNEKSGWVDNKYKDVKFTGGADATNTTLITTLESNGRLQKEQIDLSLYQTREDENLETESKDIVGAINEVNGKTVDKISEIYTNDGDTSYIEFHEGGITYSQQFGFYDEMGNTIAAGFYGQCVPIVAGSGIEFEKDEDNQVVKINAEADTSNLATVDKVKTVDTCYSGITNLNAGSYGIGWRDEFEFNDGENGFGETLASGTISHRTPIVAGKNVEFELDEENQVVKINATDKSVVGTWILNYDLNLTSAIDVDVDFTSYDADGVKREFNHLSIEVVTDDFGAVQDYRLTYYIGGAVYTVCDTLDVVWYNDMSRIITITTQPKDEEFITCFEANAIKDDPYIKKIKVILNGSEMVTDIINKMLGAGYELGQFAIFEFSGANSGTYGFTINHYGGNIYNIGGIDFGTFYTMANNVTDWSTVNMWPFFSMFQPPIPYCDESNEGQVLKVVGGVPTWV